MTSMRHHYVASTSLRRIDVSTTSCACWEFAPLSPQYSQLSYAYAFRMPKMCLFFTVRVWNFAWFILLKIRTLCKVHCVHSCTPTIISCTGVAEWEFTVKPCRRFREMFRRRFREMSEHLSETSAWLLSKFIYQALSSSKCIKLNVTCS